MGNLEKTSLYAAEKKTEKFLKFFRIGEKQEPLNEKHWNDQEASDGWFAGWLKSTKKD